MSDFKQLSRSVKGLTVLVTGAASGMGRATVRVFAAEGANVAVTDYTAAGANAVADEIAASGGSARPWKLDVANSPRSPRLSTRSPGISAGSIFSSTTPAFRCESRSTTKVTMRPGAKG